MKDQSPHAFLGEEFLTWLWYRQETGKATFEIEDPSAGNSRELGVTLADFLCLVGNDESETEQTLRHGLPTRSPEATTALLSGKRLSRARVILAEGEDVWEFTLDGPTLALLSVKCPEPDADEIDGDARLRDQARMEAFLDLSDLVDALYRRFLRERLSEAWKQSALPAMRRWVESRTA